MTVISKKMCMLGDFGVGKTSLIRRFVERQFSDRYLSTVGVKISRKTVHLKDVQTEKEQELKLLIWDIEGHTKFKSISPAYLQGSSGVLVVADLTRQETIDHLGDRIQEYREINPHGQVAIALNKSDLLEEEEVLEMKNKLSLPDGILGIYNTSAKTGNNVDTIFQELAYKLWLTNC
ncbi:Rab family GTPase [Spirulina sp. 06S082]|uniref:Rab family GTPase n=1 Tax=Spirulina sp. 06S082 TaxID=3110248 RepID=UPI002B20C523|nr:Rab family GTPase [Spirulina sp. 06S082]MEA5468736.1 Rab family GTPase [Spirulina sp. 06S082]